MITAVAVVALVAAGGTGASAAESQNDLKSNLTTLSKAVPGSTEQQMLTALTAQSKRTGEPVESIAARAVQESIAATNDARAIDRASGVAAPYSSGGSTRKVSLGRANNVGDVFYSSNSTFGVQHGHNGIYNTRDYYVEAVGIGQRTRVTSANSVTAPAPAYKYFVGYNAPSGNKNAAGSFARSKVGTGYNIVFWDNKKVNDYVYNCSQLVWAAWKSRGIDLDANGGSGVYPADIANSSWTKWYQTKY